MFAFNPAGLSAASNVASARTFDLVAASYHDSFEAGTLSPDWTFTAGDWGLAPMSPGSTNDVLKQTSSSSATSTMMKALLTGFDSDATEIRARLRVGLVEARRCPRRVGLRTDP